MQASAKHLTPLNESLPVSSSPGFFACVILAMVHRIPRCRRKQRLLPFALPCKVHRATLIQMSQGTAGWCARFSPASPRPLIRALNDQAFNGGLACLKFRFVSSPQKRSRISSRSCEPPSLITRQTARSSNSCRFMATAVGVLVVAPANSSTVALRRPVWRFAVKQAWT